MTGCHTRPLPDVPRKRIWLEILGTKRVKSPKWGQKAEAAGKHKEEAGLGDTGN